MELEGRVKFLMKSYEAPKPLSQVNKIASSCKFCNGPHETHNCMELPKRAYNEFTSSHVGRGPQDFDKAYEAWRDKPNFRGYQTRSVSFNDSSPLEWSEHSPSQSAPKQGYEDALRKFILSQELQLSTLETKFKQQQADINNKICNLLNVVKEHAVKKTNQAEEVKSVTITHQPISPVKIKSPSKLFKHLSPQVNDVRDPVNRLGPIHFVNTITTISAPTSNLSQQPTGNMGHTAKDETSSLDHELANSPTNSFEHSVMQESNKLDEVKEKSKEHTINPAILGKSIIEEPEKKLMDITSGSNDRTEGSGSKVFKISCTIGKSLLTDSHIDPSLPVNIIPFPYTTKPSLNARCMNRSITQG
jgi:hypothetical protein